MFTYKKNSNQKCFMCDELATTGDHIPPKGFFSTTQRKKKSFSPLIVPACSHHNNCTKKDDEYARTIIATGSPDSEAAMQLVDERIVPRAQKEQGKLLGMLNDSMKPVVVERESGLIEQMFKAEIERPRLQSVIDKIMRGLFWHFNGMRLPDNYVVSPYYWNRQDVADDQKVAIMNIPICHIGTPEVFKYRYATLEGDSNSVYAVMVFFESNIVEATICEKSLAKKLRRKS